MDDRQYTERLAHDLARWTRDALLTPDQERAILARIGAGEPRLVGVLRLGWLVTAVSIIGAIVMAAGVVLLFAANWQAMPDWFRTMLVFTGVIAAYSAGYLLTYRFEMDRVGGALFLLGALLYGAGLFLLAQIYNMPVNSPILALLGALGIAPVAYAFGSRIVMLVAIAAFVLWVWWDLASRYEDSGEFASVFVVVGAVGIILYAAGRLHGVYRAVERFADVYLVAGALVSLTLIYVFSFDEPWREIIDSDIESYSAPAIVYISLGIAAALVFAQWFLRPKDVEVHVEAAILAAVLAVAAVVATWPAWTGYAVVFNGVYFLAAAAIVTRGYLRGDERYVNAGLALVAMGVITRYVDVFWSLLAGSVFFLVGGFLLLGLAFALERFRRTLVSGMSASTNGGPLAPAADSPAPGAVS